MPDLDMTDSPEFLRSLAIDVIKETFRRFGINGLTIKVQCYSDAPIDDEVIQRISGRVVGLMLEHGITAKDVEEAL